MKNYYLKIFKTLIFIVLVFGIPYICKVHVLKKFFLNTIHERGSAKLARSFKHGASNFIFHGKVKFFLSVHTDLANWLNWVVLICSCPERYLSKSKMAPPSWGARYLCNHAFTVQIFRRLWCSHCAGQIFDSIGLRFDFDFGIQGGSLWTVRLNARIQFQPVENSSVAVWT